MEEVEEKVEARKWLLTWAKDEKFWKDVAANTVAGILLALVIYCAGLVLGYFQTPDWPIQTVRVLRWGCVGLLAAGALYTGWAWYKDDHDAPTRKNIKRYTLAYSLGTLAMVGVNLTDPI